MTVLVACDSFQTAWARDPDRPLGRGEPGSCPRPRRRSGTGSVPRLQHRSPGSALRVSLTPTSEAKDSRTLRTDGPREQVWQIRMHAVVNLPYRPTTPPIGLKCPSLRQRGGTVSPNYPYEWTEHNDIITTWQARLHHGRMIGCNVEDGA
jgi:hypothetical protein